MIKKTLLILLVLSIFIFILGISLSRFFDSGIEGDLNRQNIQKVEIGMNKDEVNSIMGKPDTIFTYNNVNFPYYNKKVYSYYKGQYRYGYLQVIFEPDVDTVIQVVNIEE